MKATSVRHCPPAAASGAAGRRSAWRRFGWRGLRVVGFAGLITVGLWLLTGTSFRINLVFTLCISICCWLLIDVSRMAVVAWTQRPTPVGDPPHSRWPGRRWMMPIVLVGGPVGYALGNEIANLLLGMNEPGLFAVSGRQALTVLFLAVVPAVVITYVFHARETIATQAALVQQAERQATEQQLKLLEAQLEPHMLFNTLANLRALVTVDPVRAQAMLDHLIAFLRASLAGSRSSLHPLADEFARLADYLALMQIRMGSRLQTRFELAPAAAQALVPTLLLQPLIENSIKHGLEPKIGGGRIDITAERDGDALVVRVRDTGVGLGLGRDSETGSTRMGSVGVSLVRERLATLYGARAKLDLEAVEAHGEPGGEGGTLATVRMPFELPGSPDRMPSPRP